MAENWCNTLAGAAAAMNEGQPFCHSLSRKEEATMDNERTPEVRNGIVIEDLAKSFGDVKAVNGLTLNIKRRI